MNEDKVVQDLMLKHTGKSSRCSSGIHRMWACQCKIEAAIREAISLTRKETLLEAAESVEARIPSLNSSRRRAIMAERDVVGMCHHSVIETCERIAAELRRLSDSSGTPGVE